jgi:trans-aconitate methyltransferase
MRHNPRVSDRDTYTFGDDDIASRRLARLAALYDAETRALVARAIPRRPSLALDLGCGPGWSTHLVHEVSGAPRTVGIDASDRYVAEAAAASRCSSSSWTSRRRCRSAVPT